MLLKLEVMNTFIKISPQSTDSTTSSLKAMPQNVIQPCSQIEKCSYCVHNKNNRLFRVHKVFSGPLSSFCCIHSTKIYGDLAEVVQTNRGALQNYQHISTHWFSSSILSTYHLCSAGVTLGSSAIRRRPNAFNLLHQMETMTRGGYSEDSSLQKLAVGGFGNFITCQCHGHVNMQQFYIEMSFSSTFPNDFQP